MNNRLIQIKNSIKFAVGITKSKLLDKRIPLMVSFHITNRCNLRCPYCYANYENRFNKPPIDFSTKEVEDTIDGMYRLGMRWLTLIGGEPLLRDDIGQIVRYAKRKGILVELVTNGHFVPERMEEIKAVDFICLSLEGNENQHDLARNMPGSYRAVTRALEILKDQRPKIRLHSTLLHTNMDGLLHLSELSRRYGAEFGYSQVIIHNYNDSPDVRFTDDELRNFWLSLLEFKSQGHPCYNSDYVLKYIANWPAKYQHILKDKEGFAEYPGFDFLQCQYGRRYCYIDSEGYMYRCIVRGIKNGPNIREVGVKQAWEKLALQPCISCSYIQHIEVNSLLSLKISSIIKGLKYLL